jgi:hypothetical protein
LRKRRAPCGWLLIRVELVHAVITAQRDTTATTRAQCENRVFIGRDDADSTTALSRDHRTRDRPQARLDSPAAPPILLPTRMAQEKTEAKTKSAKAKSAAKSQTESAAPGESSAPCSAGKCKQPLRAKGYCRKHFLAWRRGLIGGHHRYKPCSKEGCRKKREHGGLCAEHAGKAPPVEGAAAS